jgi:hypothetical protein
MLLIGKFIVNIHFDKKWGLGVRVWSKPKRVVMSAAPEGTTDATTYLASFLERVRMAWFGLIWLRIGTSGGLL